MGNVCSFNMYDVANDGISGAVQKEQLKDRVEELKEMKTAVPPHVVIQMKS